MWYAHQYDCSPRGAAHASTPCPTYVALAARAAAQPSVTSVKRWPRPAKRVRFHMRYRGHVASTARTCAHAAIAAAADVADAAADVDDSGIDHADHNDIGGDAHARDGRDDRSAHAASSSSSATSATSDVSRTSRTQRGVISARCRGRAMSPTRRRAGTVVSDRMDTGGHFLEGQKNLPVDDFFQGQKNVRTTFIPSRGHNACLAQSYFFR